MKAGARAVFIALLLLAGAAAPVAAQDGSFLVLLVVGERDRMPGERLNFTVYTFAGGEPAVPGLPPEVMILSGPGAGRTMPLCETAPGRYDGNYTVLSADADEHGRIGLEARAGLGVSATGGTGQWATDSAYIRLAGSGPFFPPEGLSVRGRVLECPDGAVRPGSSLTIAVLATHDGAPAPAGAILFHVEHRQANGATSSTDIPSESPAPGSFFVRYRIPDQRHSDTFYFYADGYGETERYVTSVKLDLFNVVYHELARNGPRVDYELYVSDRAGAPVNGSGVTVVTRSWPNGPGPVTLDLGKTDKKGRVRGMLDPGPGVGQVLVDGWANTSQKSQRFFGSVRLANSTSPQAFRPYSFFVERTGSGGTFAPGKTAVLAYRSTYNGKPLRLQSLDCYLELYNGVPQNSIPAGVQGLSGVTDKEGVFSLNLSFPAGYPSYTIVKLVGPKAPYSNFYETFTDPQTVQVPPAVASAPSAPWANVTFSGAVPGRAVRICATALSGVLSAARATWDFPVDASGNPGAWDVWNAFTWYLQAQPSGQAPLRGQLVLPRHLKSGQNLTVTVGLQNGSGQSTTAEFTMKVRPVPAAPAESDLCCVTSIFMVNALLIAFLFFNYMTGRRTARKKELEELGADDQIEAVLGPSRAARRELALPLRVQLAQSEECTACGRKIAQGNLALRCVCGARFHEHCTGDGRKCPSCSREWRKG